MGIIRTTKRTGGAKTTAAGPIYTNMKGLVIAFACVVGMACGQPQGQIQGNQGVNIASTIAGAAAQPSTAASQAQANAFANRIINPLDKTCGQFKGVCYGQGLNAKFVMPVSPVIAQCQAGIASRNGFLLRIDATGQMFITDRFGQNIEDIEFEVSPQQQLAFGGLNAGGNHRFAQQQDQRITQQLNIENALREIEFRCQFNQFGQQIFNA